MNSFKEKYGRDPITTTKHAMCIDCLFRDLDKLNQEPCDRCHWNAASLNGMTKYVSKHSMMCPHCHKIIPL